MRSAECGAQSERPVLFAMNELWIDGCHGRLVRPCSFGRRDGMIILPAIDLLGGHCVRLKQGKYDQVTDYGNDPAAVARKFMDAGAEWLHVVNLDGARQGALGSSVTVFKGKLTRKTLLSGPPEVNDDAMKSIIKAVGRHMKIEMGGGIRTTEDVERVLNIGVDRVIVGTRAIQEPKWLVEVSERFPDRIALGLDAQGKMLAVQGWTKAARELQTWQDLGDISLEEWARHKLQQLLVAEAKPAAIIYTDTTRDGMMTGPNFEATTAMVNAASPFPVIASGGVTTVEDVRRVKAVGAAGAIIGRALYEGTLTIEAALEAAREV